MHAIPRSAQSSGPRKGAAHPCCTRCRRTPQPVPANPRCMRAKPPGQKGAGHTRVQAGLKEENQASCQGRSRIRMDVPQRVRAKACDGVDALQRRRLSHCRRHERHEIHETRDGRRWSPNGQSSPSHQEHQGESGLERCRPNEEQVHIVDPARHKSCATVLKERFTPLQKAMDVIQEYRPGDAFTPA